MAKEEAIVVEGKVIETLPTESLEDYFITILSSPTAYIEHSFSSAPSTTDTKPIR